MQNFFPLIYQSQNYDWGKIGTNSLVYQLSQKAGLTNEENPSKPYAELWMGDHPSLSSFIVLPSGDKVRLEDAIVENPEKFLGKAYAQFQNKKRLPFLFKVLSVEKVLSLQIHPSKEIAKKLHETKPDVYKDDNHKPEISIALSEFEALCNFRPYEELVAAFKENEILTAFIGEELVTRFQTCAVEERAKNLKQIMEVFFQKEKQQIEEAITKLIAQVSAKEEKTPRDKLVLKLQTQFPFDIGVLMSYMLNYLIIQPGQAFVMDPCEPHAYVYGNCLEAMAASDNVIRGCMTPKYIDKEILTETLSYDMKNTVVLQGDKLSTHENDGFEIVEYPTRYEEFTCKRVEIKQANKETSEIAYSYPSIALILKGKGLISVKNKEDNDFASREFKEGESFLCLPDSIIKFTSHDSDVSVCITTSQAL